MDLLGIFSDTRAGLFLLSPKNMKGLRALEMAVASEGLLNKKLVAITHLRVFAGLAQSAELAVTDCRLHLRSIFNGIR